MPKSKKMIDDSHVCPNCGGRTFLEEGTVKIKLVVKYAAGKDQEGVVEDENIDFSGFDPSSVKCARCKTMVD